MTLRKKLMLSFLILVLLMGSMIGYFSYQNAKNLVLENKEQEMADTINRIDISINSQVQQINRLAENVKSSQIVRAYLKKEIHTQEETEELNDWMEGLLNLISSCSDLILMNEDGTVYYSYSGCQAVNDKRRMEVYENAASNLVGDGTWTEKGSSLCQKNAEEVVTFISSINKVILAIELNPEMFGLLMLNNYSTFQNQYTYLVDCAGNVLCSNKTNIYDWGDIVTKGMEKGVEIRVTDDGIGMQSDRLMRFRESIMSDEISGKHIGMRNVHRRIQLHFGEAYGLKIDSEWQKGTTVTILLPVEEVDQAKEVTEDENRNCR